jgi:hypothetical protein
VLSARTEQFCEECAELNLKWAFVPKRYSPANRYKFHFVSPAFPLRISPPCSKTGAPRALHKAHRAMAESNLPELSRAAHTIKGMLRNLSMNSAAQSAAALEKSAQDAAEKEPAQVLLILEGDLAKILPEVEGQLAGVKA